MTVLNLELRPISETQLAAHRAEEPSEMRPATDHTTALVPFLSDLATLGRHRNVQIVSRLRAGAMRFNEVVASFPAVGEDGIDNSLRELDRAGLVTRRVDPGPPLRVLYALTPGGERLAPALESLAAWVAESTAPALGIATN